MSSTFVADTSDSHKSDNTVIIIVNSDGSLSVDQETLQSLLANQQNTNVSVVRVGVGGIDGGAGKEGVKNSGEGEDDGSPQLDLTVEGIFPAAANASSQSGAESTRAASSLTAVSALAAAASVAQDVSVDGAANPGVSVGGGSSATPGGTSAASTGEGLDPFLEMDPEQLQRLETALQSEQAKQILGEGVTAMLDMLSSDEQTNLTDTIRMDHCYTSLGPGSAPPNPSSQGPYSSGTSGEGHSGRRVHRVDASDDEDDDDEDEEESSDSGESYGEPSRSRGRGRGRGRARGRLGGRWAGSGIRGRGGRGSRGGNMRGARGSGAHVTQTAPIIPKPPPPVVQKVISATSSAITNISPSLAAVTAASLIPPSNVGTGACLVPVLKQLDLNPTITRTETIGTVSSKEPVKVVMMPAVLDRKHGAQHATVPQGIMIIPGKCINPAEVKPVITTQRVITSSVPVNIAPKASPTLVAVPKPPKLAMGSSPTVTTVVMSTHGVQPKVEVVQQPKVCLTAIGDISGIRTAGDASKVKVEKLSSPEILSMQSGLESSREEDDGETTATTTDNTEDTEEDDIPDSGGADDERDESVRSGRALHGGRRSWGGARVRGRGLRGFRLERESGMGVLVRGGRGGTRGRRRAGRPRSSGDGGRGRGGRGGKRIPEPEEDHSQVAADAVAMGVHTNTPKKPIIMMGRGGKKVIMQEKVHVEKLPQQDIGVPVSALEETQLTLSIPENMAAPHVDEKPDNVLNSLASSSPPDSHPSTSIASKVSGLGSPSEAMLSASRKLYPKRENRKPPAHLADAFGPALFSAPDVMRRVPDHTNPDAPEMVMEQNSEADEELRLVLSEDEDEKAMREMNLLKSKSTEVDVTPKPKEVVKEVEEPKVVKMERVETSTVKVVEEASGSARGGRRRRTAAAAKRLAKKEEMEEAMASDDDEEDEEEEDDDASVNSEDDPNRLWCICKKPHNNRFMICCDICEDWFHGKCVGVTKAMGRQMEEKGQEWNCPNCTVKQQKEKEKEKKSSSMADEDWDPGKKKAGGGVASNSPAAAVAAAVAGGTNGRRRKSTGVAVAPKTPSPPPQPLSTEKKKQQQPIQNQQHSLQQQKADVSGAVVAAMVKESDSGAASEKKKIMYCIVCKKEARPTSIYCSDTCILKHAQESLSLISKEKQSGVSAPAVGQSKAAPVPVVVKDVSKVQEPPVAQHSLKPSQDPTVVVTSGEGSKTTTLAIAPKVAKGDARVIVYERKTGRLMTGANAPTVSNLKSWLKDHPTFEVVRPGVLPTKFYGNKVVVSKKPAEPSAEGKQQVPVVGAKTVPVAIAPKTLVSTPGPKGNKTVGQHTPKTPTPTPTKAAGVTTPTTSKHPSKSHGSGASKSPIKCLPLFTPSGTIAKTSTVVTKTLTKCPVSQVKTSVANTTKVATNSPKSGTSGGAQPQELTVSKKLVELKHVTQASGTVSINVGTKRPSISSADGKSDGESSVKKTRMPSGTGAPPTPASTSSTGPSQGTNNANNCEPIRLNVQKTLQELLQKRIQECDDLNVSEEDVKKMALNIEEELYGYFKDTGMKYKSKYRSLVFNIKDPKNLALFRKIVEGQVDPHRLVRMSPEELASQELAQWRERETKHQLEMIKKNELDMMSQAITYVMKTHKGEQVIEKDENLKLQESVESKLEPPDPSLDIPPTNSVTSTVEDIMLESSPFSKHKDDFLKDRDDKSHEKDRSMDKHRRDDKDASGRGGERKGDRKSERKSDRKGDSKGSSSHKDERRKDRGKSSRHHDRRKDSSRSSGNSSSSSHRSTSSSNSSSKESKEKKKDGEKDSLKMSSKLGEEKSGELMEVKEEVESDTKDTEGLGLDDVKKEDLGKYEGSSGLWGTKLGKGLADDSDTSDREPSSTVTIKTPDIDTDEAEKGASATVWKGFVSMSEVAKFFTTAHPVSGSYMDLSNDLPDCVDIVGRISPDTVWEYISKMKKSGTKEIVVVRLTPANDEEKISYLYLYNYLAIRNRFGVVGNASKTVKDFYLMPLASHSIVPQVLLPLDGPGFEDFRPHLLIGIIVRLRKKKGEKYGNTRKLSTASSESMSSAVPYDGTSVKKETNFERSYTPPLPLEEDKNVGKCPGSFTPPHPPPAIESSYTPPHVSSSPPPQGILPSSQATKRKSSLPCSSDVFTDGGSKSPINTAPPSLSPLVANLGPLVASLGPLPKNLGNIRGPSASVSNAKMEDEDTPYSPGGSDPDTDTGPLLPGLGGDIPVTDRTGSRLGVIEDDDGLLSTPKDSVELARKMEELNRKIEEQKQQIQTISSAMVGSALPKSSGVVSSVSSEPVPTGSEPLGVSTMLRSFSHILGGTDSMGTGARCSPGSTNGADARDDEDEAYSPSRSFTPPPQAPTESTPVPPPISLPPDTSSISLPSNLQEILASIKRRDEGAGAGTSGGSSGTKVLSLKSDPIVMNYGGADEEEDAGDEDIEKQSRIEKEKKEIQKEEAFSQLVTPTIPLLLAPKDPRPRRDPRSRPPDTPKSTAPTTTSGSKLSALTDAELIAKAAEMVEATEPKPIIDPPSSCNQVNIKNVTNISTIGVPPLVQCSIPVVPQSTALPMKSVTLPPSAPGPVAHMTPMVTVSNTANLPVSAAPKIMIDSLVSAQPPPPGLEMESPVSYSSPTYTKKPPATHHQPPISSSTGGICTPPPNVPHIPIVADTSVPPPSSFTPPPRSYSHPPPPVNLQSSHSYSSGPSLLSSSFSSYVGPPDEDLVPPGTEEESVERCPVASQEDTVSRDEKVVPGESSCIVDDMEGEDVMDSKRYQYHRGGHRDRWTWRHRGRGGFRGHKYHGGRDYGWGGGDGRKMHHGWHEWEERDRSSRDKRGGSLDERRPPKSRHDSGGDRRSRKDSEERSREGRRRDSSDSKGSSRSSRRDSAERRSKRSSRGDSRDSDERSRKSHGHSSRSRRRSRSRHRSKDWHRSSSHDRKKARRSKDDEAESGSGDGD